MSHFPYGLTEAQRDSPGTRCGEHTVGPPQTHLPHQSRTQPSLQISLGIHGTCGAWDRGGAGPAWPQEPLDGAQPS